MMTWHFFIILIRANHKSFFFASGKLSMLVSIPTMNYFVGDVCRISLTVDNDSTKNVDDIKVVLFNFRRHTALGWTNHYLHTVHKQKYENCVRHKTKEEMILEFPVPYVVSSIHTRNTTSIYLLEVRLDVPWAVDLKVRFPIEILARDPKAAHLIPPAGALIKPSPKKYYHAGEDYSYVPEFPVNQPMSPYQVYPQLEVQNFPPPVPAEQQPTYTPAPNYYAPDYSVLSPDSTGQHTVHTQETPAPHPAAQGGPAEYSPHLPAAHAHPAAQQPTAQWSSAQPAAQGPPSQWCAAHPAMQQPAAQEPAQDTSIQGQDQFGAPLSLAKKEQPSASLQKERVQPQTVEHLPTAPPLYPAIEGYEYPANINAAVVEYGTYKVDDDEKSLLH